MFGLVVIGPAGSGKTTLCHGIHEWAQESGREVSVINLDPANDATPFEASVDIQELVTAERVMEEEGLGPNGALFFCMEYLLANADWFFDRVARLRTNYVVVDCPGQAELYVQDSPFVRFLRQWMHPTPDAAAPRRALSCCTVMCIDSALCRSAETYLAACYMAMNSMLCLETPHINVLTKIDLLANYCPLEWDAFLFFQPDRIHHLLAQPRTPFDRFLIDSFRMIEDYSLVHFQPLDVRNPGLLISLLLHADRASGYALTYEHDLESIYPMHDDPEEFSRFLEELKEQYNIT